MLRAITTRIKRAISQYRRRVRNWYDTVKGPPPKVHGVIPFDPEAGLVGHQEWLNNLDARAYLRDPNLCLRPGKAWKNLRPAVQLDPIPRYAFRHELDIERAGWRPTPLEVNHD